MGNRSDGRFVGVLTRRGSRAGCGMSERGRGSRGVFRAAALAAVSAALVSGCMPTGSCASSGVLGDIVPVVSWGGLLAAPPASASCSAGVAYHGRFYVGASRLPVVKGRPLGRAYFPPCNDTGC